MNTEHLGHLLATVDDHPPAGGPDIGALLAAGRARARRRRLGQAGLTVTAVAALAAATATAAAAWPGHHAGDRHRTPTAGSSRPAATVPAATVPAAPDRYDPTVRTVDFGALPAGLAPHGSELTPASQVAYAGVADPGHGPVTEAELEVHARGWNPDQPDQGEDVACARGAPTDPVNGRPAFLAAQPDRSGHSTNMRCVTGLVWEYAPGSWAEVRTTGDSTTAQRQAARDIATGARFGLNLPQALPFQLAGIPAGTQVYGTRAATAGQRDGFKGGGGITLVDGAGKHLYLGCEANDTTSDNHAGRADRQVNGHPALFIPPDQLFVFKVNGGEVSVEARRTQAELAALAATVHPVDDPADPGHWTTHFLP